MDCMHHSNQTILSPPVTIQHHISHSGWTTLSFRNRATTYTSATQRPSSCVRAYVLQLTSSTFRWQDDKIATTSTSAFIWPIFLANRLVSGLCLSRQRNVLWPNWLERPVTSNYSDICCILLLPIFDRETRSFALPPPPPTAIIIIM